MIPVNAQHYSLSDGCRWAWHNPHITRRIANEQRITISKSKASVSHKTGRTQKRPARPRISLSDTLSNLQLLLRVPSFSRLPLQVRFFCGDVYRKWQSWTERANGSIEGAFQVVLDLKKPEGTINNGEVPVTAKAEGKRKREQLGKGGIEGLDIGYSELKDHVEKSIAFLAEDEDRKCALCAKPLGPTTAMALTCPRENCRTASHMICLAIRFIEDEGVGAAITPISGRCPGCNTELQWIDLTMELSLRARGEKEVAQMMKKPKARKIKVPRTKSAATSPLQAHSVIEEDIEGPDEDLVEADMRALDASDESLPDDWQHQDDDGVDKMSVISGHSSLSNEVEATSPIGCSSTVRKLPAVIEDSEWDDAELLD